MPEKIDNRTIWSLKEVASSIRKTISERYRSAYWIKAEMVKLGVHRTSGHAYLELADKKDGMIIARTSTITSSFIGIASTPLLSKIILRLMSNPPYKVTGFIV